MIAPHPQRDEGHFVSFLSDLAKMYPHAILMPAADGSVAFALVFGRLRTRPGAYHTDAWEAFAYTFSGRVKRVGKVE